MILTSNDIIDTKVARVNTQKLPPFWTFLFVSLVLALVGWGGLAMLIVVAQPTLAPRWLFFFLFMLALTGTALPVTYFLNRRFPTTPPVDGSVVLREAMWVGVYGSLLAWLQLGRVLTTGLIFVLAMGLLLVEFLLRISERSQWSPTQAAEEPEDTAAPASAKQTEPKAAQESAPSRTRPKPPEVVPEPADAFNEDEDE